MPTQQGRSRNPEMGPIPDVLSSPVHKPLACPSGARNCKAFGRRESPSPGPEPAGFPSRNLAARLVAAAEAAAELAARLLAAAERHLGLGLDSLPRGIESVIRVCQKHGEQPWFLARQLD